MKPSSLEIIFSVLFLIAAAGCSGGGGGGEESSSSSSAQTGIRILHGSVEAAPIDLISSLRPAEITARTRFAEVTPYAALDLGPQIISAVRARVGGNELFQFAIDVQKRERRSVVLYGDGDSLGLQANLLLDVPGEVPSEKCAIRFVHTLVGAHQIAASLQNSATPAEVSFGQASSYQECLPGQNQLSVQRVVDKRVVLNDTILTEAGQAYTVLVSGEIDYFVIQRLYQD